ncbi:MAG: cytochrome P450 [Streptosporangiales bacterium]|nr:cytochrome P450 [Streptosporangiales bacterium]
MRNAMAQPTIEPADFLGFNPLHPSFRQDPYPEFGRLREAGPLVRTASGTWVTAHHQVAGAVLRSPAFGHGDGPSVQRRSDPNVPPSFLVLDPPEHTRLRGLVSRAFTARVVERLRPRVADVVTELLDDALETSRTKGSVNLIEALAYPLPVIVICELLGVPPEDQERFRTWSEALARGLDPDFMMPEEIAAKRTEARGHFVEYFLELIERRRREPGDDLISGLLAIEAEGDRLSVADLLATLILLLVAGHETTVNLIGNGALALARHPDQLAAVRADPSLAPSLVEEVLRYDPPVQLTGRQALTDTELAGHAVRRGELMFLLIGGANRDPAVFDDPDRFDVTRAPGRHYAFGLGVHFCLGAPLARLEGELALGELVRRSATIELAAPAPTYKDNLILRGLAELPLAL